MKPPRCPRCGEPATKSSTKYGFRFDCCGLWSWGAHPLADAKTHAARRAAHEAFDPLWKRHGFSRGRAYALLAAELGLTEKQCHMKRMTEQQARAVPAAVERILKFQPTRGDAQCVRV